MSLFEDEEKHEKEKLTIKYKVSKFFKTLRPYAIGVIRKGLLKLIDISILYFLLRIFKLM